MARPRRPLTRPRDDDHGAVAVLTAVAVVALIGSAALAVDLGRLAWDRRDLQGIADAAALDAIQAFGLRAGDDYDALAASSAVRNGFDGPVETRALVDDDGDLREVSGDEHPEAVEVTLTRDIDYLFAFFAPDGGTNTVSATALTEEVGGLQIGTRLASLDTDDLEVEVLNALLSEVDGDVDLDAASYNGLANAHIEVGELLAELEAVAGGPALDTEVTLSDVLSASASALSDDAAAAATLNGLSESVDHVTLVVGEWLRVTSRDPDGAAKAEIDALSLVQASALAGHEAGSIELDVSMFDPLGGEDGQLQIATAVLQVVEAPQVAFGPARTDDGAWRTWARSAQVQLDAELRLVNLFDDDAVDGSTEISVPLTVSGGRGLAELTDVDCDPSTRSLTIEATTEALTAELGAFSLGSGLLEAMNLDYGGETVTVADGQQTLLFDPEFGPGSEPQTVGSGSSIGSSLASTVDDRLPLPDILDDELLDDLLGSLLDLLGLGSNQEEEVRDLLRGEYAHLAALDEKLIDPVLDAVGVGVGEADVWGLHHECGRRSLVR